MPSGVSNLDPSGTYFRRFWTLASINMTPEQVEERSGAHFETSRDDLGIVHAAIFQTTTGITAGMWCHPEYFSDRVDLFVDEATPHPDGWLSLALAILRELNLVDLPEVEVLDYLE